MVQIIPSILSTTEAEYSRDSYRYQNSGSLKNGWVHIDFMDNIFVPNKSIEPVVIAKYRLDLYKEAHLMVLRPMDWIDDLVKAGFKRIIIHIEAEKAESCVDYIKNKGLKVGLAIDHKAEIEKLEPFVGKIDVVLVMTIDKPGFQGQSFNPQALEKVKTLRSKNWPVKIGVDGAVKDDNIKEILKTGVDFVIVGSFLLKGDIDENVEKLWEAIND